MNKRANVMDGSGGGGDGGGGGGGGGGGNSSGWLLAKELAKNKHDFHPFSPFFPVVTPSKIRSIPTLCCCSHSFAV